MRRANHGADEVAAAVEQLGERHALVRLLRASRVVAEGMLSVAGVAAGGVLEIGLPLVVAAVIVEVGLCARWLSIRSSLRSVCLELISRGEERLGLTPLLRVRGRLDSARHRARLARSIVEAVRILHQRPARVPAARPLFSLRVVRPVAPELREVSELLLRGGGGPRGVAVVERLLTSATSPLYGAEVGPLRDELRRARFLLQART